MWTTPRTWIPYELVTDTMLNLHVRDNLNAVTRVIKSLTEGAGIPNTPAGINTVVFSYILPPSLLATDGDTVIVEAWGVIAANANQKAIAMNLAGLSMASTGVVTASGGAFHVRCEIRRLTSAAVMSNYSVSLPTGILQNVLVYGGMNWAIGNELQIITWAAAANDLRLHSVILQLNRAGTGV